MSVSKKREKKPKQYSKQNVSEALSDITNNVLSATNASKTYKIPTSTSKKQYSDDCLTDALADIRDNAITSYAASKKYKIPVSTIRDRLKGLHSKSYGAPTILTLEEESQLAEWVILCAKSGFPKTQSQILGTATQIANLNPIKTFIRGKPTSGWFQKFKKRHPEVAKRTQNLWERQVQR